MLARIAAEGYVRRATSEDDGRGQVITITASGKALLRKMWPVYRAFIAEHFAARLTATETKSLAALLQKLAGTE